MSNIRVRVGQQNATKVLSSNSVVLSGITVKDESVLIGIPGGFNALNFIGNGIGVTAFLSEAVITIYDATTTSKGVASYNGIDFYVNNGVVGINTEKIQDIIGQTLTSGIQTNITLTYDDFNNHINAYVATASTTNLGVASFSSNGFNVQNGAVTLNVGAGITIYNSKISFKNYFNLNDNKIVKWDNTNLQLTNSILDDNGTYLTINGELYVNNGCSSGSKKIVGCDNEILILDNLTIDCGEY